MDPLEEPSAEAWPRAETPLSPDLPAEHTLTGTPVEAPRRGVAWIC